MNLGEKIKYLRKKAGYTQTEFGKLLNVQKNAVSKWECGRVEDIPASKIKAMAELFDIPVYYLIADEYDVVSENGRLEACDQQEKTLLNIFRNLNGEGQEKVLEYISDLYDTGKYKKHNPGNVDAEAI